MCRDGTQEKLKMKNNAMASSDNEDIDDYSKISMKQSNSFGNLMESRAHGSNFNVDTTTMKRNKSFWRFSKSEDILMEGMALWKHRDLVPIDGEFVERPPPMIVNRVDEATLKKQEKSKKTNTLQTKSDKSSSQQQQQISSKKMEKNKSSTRNTSEKKSAMAEPVEYKTKHSGETMQLYRESNKNMHPHDDDDIYDESPKKRNDTGPTQTLQKRPVQQQAVTKQVYGDRKKNFHRDSSLQETNFYEDDVFVMKTVKRKEILKQYYSSGTDTELSSSDPYDPYDCIIVDDHQLSQAQSTLRNRNSYAAETSESRAKAYQQQKQHHQQQRSSKTESLSGTLLPRTKLSKSVQSETNDFNFSDRISTTRSNKIASKEKWTNLWSE